MQPGATTLAVLLAALAVSEVAKWGAVIRAAGVKANPNQ